jgi:hypothetical protein
MTIAKPTVPQVEVPAGVKRVSEWETDEPTPRRYVSTANYRVVGHSAVIWWDATQFADGSIDVDRDPPTVRVDGLAWEHGLSSEQARVLAAVLIEGADEIDRWASS